MRTVFLAFFCLFAWHGVSEASNEEFKLVEALLKESAPARDWEKQKAFGPKPQMSGGRNKDGSTELKGVKWVRANKANLPDYLEYIRKSPAVAKEILRDFESRAEQRSPWGEPLSQWLYAHFPKLLKNYLVRLTETLKLSAWGLDWRPLELLAQCDETIALETVYRYISGPNPFLRVYGLCFLAKHHSSDEDKVAPIRHALRVIVEDPEGKGWARQWALNALLEQKWEGQKNWYLRLFSDPTLQDLYSGNLGHRSLTVALEIDSEYWIPKIIPLVGHKNKAIHNNAVKCMLSCPTTRTFTALIPWLFDIDWANVSSRQDMLDYMDSTLVPKAIDGLIEVIQTEDSRSLIAAARALTALKARKAIPALIQAFHRAEQTDDARRLFECLEELNGFKEAQICQAIERFAVYSLNPNSPKEKYERVLKDKVVELGRQLMRSRKSRDNNVLAISNWVTKLKLTKPKVAEKMVELCDRWECKEACKLFFKEISMKNLKLQRIKTAIDKQSKLKPFATPSLAAQTGVRHAFVAVIAEDRGAITKILNSGNRLSCAMVLACARLQRFRLPEDKVGSFLSDPKPLLRYAAKTYLWSIDSSKARHILQTKYKSSLILGAREQTDSVHDLDGQFSEWENKLKKEMDSNKDLIDIFACLTSGGWGDQGQTVIRLFKDKTTLTFYEDEQNTWTRILKKNELHSLLQFLDKSKFEQRPPYSPGIFDGLQREYFRVNKKIAIRVFMNNPMSSWFEDGPDLDWLNIEWIRRGLYGRVVKEFEKLKDGLQLNFASPLNKVPGAKLIYANHRLPVYSLRKSGDRLCFYAEPRYNKYVWRPFNGKRLGPTTELPHLKEIDFEYNLGELRHEWELKTTRGYLDIHDESDGENSLIEKTRNGRVLKRWLGEYSAPMTNPAGTWAMATLSHRDSQTTVSVRIDLNSGKVHRMNISYLLKAYCEGQKAFLVKDQAGQFQFLDPKTGQTRKAEGNLKPILTAPIRPFQIQKGTKKLWVTLQTGKQSAKKTQLGLFDPEKLSFKPIQTFPWAFDASQMWVNEEKGKIWVIYGRNVFEFDCK